MAITFDEWITQTQGRYWDGYNEAMRMLDKKINQLETLIRETKGTNQ